MKNFSKKFLAILLTVAMLATFPIASTVSAEEGTEEAAKQALITAWQAIASETTKKAIQIGLPNVSAPKEVTSQTTVEGLDDVTKLGSHYVWQDPYATNAHVFIKRTNLTNTNDYDEVYFYLNVYDENKQPISANVTTYVQNTYWIDTTVDGWTKVPFKKADANITAGIRFHSGNAAVKYISYGSLWGVKEVNGPAVPENASAMTLKELVSAAKAVDYKGFASTAAFESALAEAEVVVKPQLVTEELVSAWQAIASETTKKAIQIGLPNVTTPIEVTNNTEIGIDNSLLGSHYVEYQEYTSYSSQGGIYIKRTNLTNTIDYDEVYIYLNAYDAEKNPIDADFATYVQNQLKKEETVSGWTKMPFAIGNLSITSGIRFFTLDTKVKYVSYGSLWGVKDVSGPAVPENASTMTLKELVAAAKAVDYKGFASTAKFETALAEAEAQLPAEPVNITVNFENGTVTGLPKEVYAGDTVTLTATADEYYKFDGWYVGEELVCETATYSFTATADVTVIAKFSKIQVNVTAVAGDNGTVVPVPESIFAGDTVTFTAVANTGYKFVGWFNGDNLVSSDAEYKLTVTADITLTAKFEAIKGDINVDGTVDADDMVLLRQFVLGEKKSTDRAYINADDVVDIRDMVALLKVLG